uniref:Integrase core domain containing protein n=1 Tax=Solanum tuberosum TaxID=4113 RepID=M1DL59_SOLTU
MEHMMDHKVQALNQPLDAFERRVLERPAPTTDVSGFKTELASLRADLDTLLDPPETERESAPISPTGAAQRAFIMDEELRQQRAREIGVGASRRVGTTDGVARVDVSITEGAAMVDAGTTDGNPIVDLAGSGKSDPPAC